MRAQQQSHDRNFFAGVGDFWRVRLLQVYARWRHWITQCRTSRLNPCCAQGEASRLQRRRAPGCVAGICEGVLPSDRPRAGVYLRRRSSSRSKAGLGRNRGCRSDPKFAPSGIHRTKIVSQLKLAGLLPAELQRYVVYCGAVTMDSPSPESALAFLRLLSDPAKGDNWKAAGFEPQIGSECTGAATAGFARLRGPVMGGVMLQRVKTTRRAWPFSDRSREPD